MKFALILIVSFFGLSLITPMLFIGGIALFSQAAVHNKSYSKNSLYNVPGNYGQIILDAQKSVGCQEIAPSIIAGQLEVESNFNPNANNGIAKGIAQFQQATFDANAVDGDNDGKKDIFNATDSIYTQYKYMCKLYNHFNNLRQTLAHYNCGCDSADQYVDLVEKYAIKYNNTITDIKCDNCADLMNRINELSHTYTWFDKCELFVERAFNTSSQYPSAIAHYNAMNAMGKIHKDDEFTIPAGKIVYFSGSNPFGHVVVSLGNGMVASTDILVQGEISIVNINEIIGGHWRMNYLGWSDPIWH